MKVSVEPWGNAPDGTPVELYTLSDGKLLVRVTNFGGVVQTIQTPDRDGKMADVTLGFDDVTGYATDSTYQSAAIGRYGNRLGGAAFTIDGVDYHVTANEGKNCLHGGKPGFDKVVWDATSFNADGKVGVELHRLSPDGEQGFPGNLDVNIRLWLDGTGSLSIAYEARTDKATPVNLTHHMYYNLSGDSANDILGEELQIKADKMTPVDSGLIPTGELAPVTGTPFDFTTMHKIGDHVDDKNEQLSYGGGYDHNFVFTSADGTLKSQCVLYDPKSGRQLEILTTEPAVQFYSGNGLSGAIGRDGKPNLRRHALCLETQHYPDGPNHPNFPDTVLRPGQLYSSMTVLHFSVK